MGFSAKEKEPKLSQEMQEILNKSQDGKGGLYHNDIAKYKYKIIKMLTSNQDILRTLHNASLEILDSEGNINGDAYRDVSIFNFLKIPGTQSEVKNYICFDINDVEQPRYNDSFIIKNIVFRTVSHEEDYHTDWGISRHDLLAIIIQSEFDWTNAFGMHFEKISDRGRVAENGYYYREFIYETTVHNNVVNKLKNGGLSEDYGAFRR